MKETESLEPADYSPYKLWRSIDAKNLRFTIDGVQYYWLGGFGEIFHSYEEKMKLGDVRMIGGIPFHVSIIQNNGWFIKPKISWTIPAQFLSTGWIQNLKSIIFQ